jgi:vancomycin resistance protein YoaR
MLLRQWAEKNPKFCPNSYMAKSQPKTMWLKAVIGTALVLIALVLVAVWATIAIRLFYKDKIYPGIYAGSVDLGGQTKDEARKILEAEVDKMKSGVAFVFQDKKVVVSLNSVSLDGSLAFQLFSPDVEKTVNEAWSSGRQDSYLNSLGRQTICWLSRCHVNLALDYNKPKILDLLKEQFGSFESPARDAELAWEDNGAWRVEAEKFGRRFDYEAIFASFEATLKQFKNNEVRLILEEDAPKIFAAEVVPNLNEQIQSLLAQAPITFTFESKTWTAKNPDVKSWIGLSLKYDKNKRIVVADFTDKLLSQYLDSKIGPSVNQEPLEPKFALKDGRVEEFQTARDGREIDKEATIASLRQAIETGNKEVTITVKNKGTEYSSEVVNSLNIVEIIGTGTSTFTGSPANRRHNIAVGAKAINGLLIKPGEEFSLVKALGEIDAKAGYLQELVIKQNKTIPEFGGGLCQIGTTMFRTALASGLPITERRNHSYRVVYYEPAGTDATIYDPWPDFKFINDTGNYILIQTRISGNTAIFDFWGKRDGRTVAPIKPSIYNIVKPPPVKTVETLDLKPGVKKCTEGAHNGADAWFLYKVTYPTGEIKETKFSSHYVPWQAVCLIGVEKLSDPNAPADGQIPPVNPDAAIIVAPTSTTQN